MAAAQDVLAALDIQMGTTVVDISAGTGYFSIPISDWLGASGLVYAVDVQPEMLELLRKKLRHGRSLRKIVLHQGKADHVPLPNQSADLVLLANIWHELSSQEAVLTETRRLLKLGGRLAISTGGPIFPAPRVQPQEHRVPEAAVCDLLCEQRWMVQVRRTIGTFSYLVIANPTA